MAKIVKPTFLIFFGIIFSAHRGSCDDCEGGVGWLCDTNRTEKNQPTFSIFSARFSSHIEGPVIIEMGRCVCGWFSDKNRAKKVKPTFSIFWRNFCHPLRVLR